MIKTIIATLALVLGIYTSAHFGAEYVGFPPDRIPALSLTAGLGVLACLFWETSGAIGVFVLIYAAKAPLFQEGHGSSALLYAFFYAMVEACQALLIARLCSSDLPLGLKNFGHLLRLGLLTVFLPALVMGVALAVILALGEYFPVNQILSIAWQHCLSNTMGILVAAPFFWAWRDQSDATPKEKIWIPAYCGALLLVLFLAITAVPALIYLTVPILVGLGIQTGLRGELIGQALLLVTLAYATARGMGPMASANHQHAYLQLFSFMTATLVGMMALAINQTGYLRLNSGVEARIKASENALINETKRRETLEIQLVQRANFDDLTGLPNRALFFDRVNQAIAHARRNSARFALLFIDLDRVKQINDTLGHDVGDQLFKEVAVRLKDCLRDSDTVARIGGDEFTMVLHDVVFSRNAAMVAEKVIEKLAMPINLGVDDCRISVSIGIALYPDDGENDEILLKNADTAMYNVKKRGGDGWLFYGQNPTALDAPEKQA